MFPTTIAGSDEQIAPTSGRHRKSGSIMPSPLPRHRQIQRPQQPTALSGAAQWARNKAARRKLRRAQDGEEDGEELPESGPPEERGSSDGPSLQHGVPRCRKLVGTIRRHWTESRQVPRSKRNGHEIREYCPRNHRI